MATKTGVETVTSTAQMTTKVWRDVQCLTPVAWIQMKKLSTQCVAFRSREN